ncbi:MAG: hypothetical protein RBS24_06985 [Bacilli bacterium]|nr:hypothetical protein [Bacilli bacterium]
MWKVLGTTEDKTVCECCGKQNLKKTVALENEAGEIKYMGVDCASKAMIGKKNKTQADFIWKTAQAIEFAKKNIARLGAKECRNRILVFGIACTDNGKDSILFYNDVIVSK